MVVDEKTDFREIARDGGITLRFRAGDFIFREGDAASCMYIVLKGSVEMSTRDKIVVTIPEGKPFGMLSLIDKKPRANSARAKEECELALLDERAFRVLVEETPVSSGTSSTSSRRAFARPTSCCSSESKGAPTAAEPGALRGAASRRARVPG